MGKRGTEKVTGSAQNKNRSIRFDNPYFLIRIEPFPRGVYLRCAIEWILVCVWGSCVCVSQDMCGYLWLCVSLCGCETELEIQLTSKSNLTCHHLANDIGPGTVEEITNECARNETKEKHSSENKLANISLH